MKKEFFVYLGSIDISNTLIEALQKKYKLLTAFADVKEFEDIFLSESISNLGNREYFSLWGFTPTTMCKISVTKPELGVFRIKDYLSNILSDELNFELINANPNSRFQISTRRRDADKSISLNSTGKNCEHLFKICKKYILPNINL